jgi:RHS repeat-associated protein
MEASRLGFTGAYLDPAVSEYILGNGYRWYLPSLMRFTAPDDWSPFEAGGINPYAYCAANPIDGTDPTGHMFFEATTIERIDEEAVANALLHSLGADNPDPSRMLNADEVDKEIPPSDRPQHPQTQKRASGATSPAAGPSGSIPVRRAAEASVADQASLPFAKRPGTDGPADNTRKPVTGISLAHDFGDELENAKANPLELPVRKKADRVLEPLHRFASEVRSSGRFFPPEYRPSLARWAGFNGIKQLRTRLYQETEWATDALRVRAIRTIEDVVGL